MKKPARGKRKASRRSPREAQGPMRRAATILERAGLPAGRIPRTVRQLARVFGSADTEREVRPEVVVTEVRALSLTRAVDEASAHFERGQALEESDVAAAREAYAQALATHGDHLEARINLGRLMHMDGELEAAAEVYRAARQGSALLAFNLALVLEDLGRDEEAVSAYRDSLALDPTMHEAHLNLGFLYERQQRPREALRHMLAFRRGAPYV